MTIDWTDLSAWVKDATANEVDDAAGQELLDLLTFIEERPGHVAAILVLIGEHTFNFNTLLNMSEQWKEVKKNERMEEAVASFDSFASRDIQSAGGNWTPDVQPNRLSSLNKLNRTRSLG